MTSTKALANLRVLDISTFVSAPFAAACLAEFGAEVLKIEKPGTGDSLRQLGTQSPTGDTYFWLSEARNKKCVTLDLRKPQGSELFRRMVKKADVVIENFRPGTLEKWGLGFSDLLAINPALLMLRVSAYGEKGPKSHLPGFARIAQAYAGLTYLVGRPDTPPLIAGSTTLADYISGLYGAFGILLALRVRDQTVEGSTSTSGCTTASFDFWTKLLPSMTRPERFASAWARRRPAPLHTATIPPGTGSGWRSLAPTTRCSSVWPASWLNLIWREMINTA